MTREFTRTAVEDFNWQSNPGIIIWVWFISKTLARKVTKTFELLHQLINISHHQWACAIVWLCSLKMLFRINLPFTLAVTNAVIVTNSYHNAVLKPVGDMVVTCFYFFYFFVLQKVLVIMMFWLTDVLRWLAAQNLYGIQGSTLVFKTQWCVFS